MTTHEHVEAWYNTFGFRAMSFIKRRGLNDWEAEDCFHNAVTSMLVNLPKVKAKDFNSYAWKRITSAVKDHWRGRKRELDFMKIIEKEDTSYSPEEEGLIEYAYEVFNKSPRLLEVAELLTYGCTLSDISIVLDISKETANKYLVRVRKKLREYK